MIRRIGLGAIMSLAIFAFVPYGMSAPLPDNCDKDRGVINCQTSDPVGNSENSGGKSQERETDEFSRGNLKNDTNTPPDCTTGPGNQSSCD